MRNLCNSTNIELDHFAQLVREGKSLEEARRFAQYVLNSRLVDLLEANPQPFPLACDGNAVRTKAEQLQRDIQLRWERCDTKPHIPESELATISQRLKTLEAHLLGESAKPTLRVLNGAG